MALRALSLLSLLLAVPSAAAEVRIGGRLALPSGVGLADVEVTLVPLLSAPARARTLLEGTPIDPVARGRTGEDGRFAVVAPHAGLWRVRAEAEGLVPLEFDLEPLIEPIELPEAELVADAGMTVTVTDSKGTPLAGAIVLVRTDESRWPFGGASEWRIPPRGGRSGADGKLRLPRGESERVIVSASHPGLLHAERGGNSGSAARLALPAGVARRVEVRSAAGEPLAGVMLAVGDRLHPLGLTDDRGRLDLRIERARPVSAALLAADGRELATRLDPRAWDEKQPDAPLAIVLPDRLAVSGRLVDARSRRSIAGGVVWDERKPRDGFVTDDHGGFVVAGPAHARLELSGAAPGYLRSQPIEVQLADDGRPGPTLPLEPAAAIEGKVVDPDGEPVPGAALELEVRRPESGRMRIEIGRQALTPRAVSGPGGAFRLGPVDPGESYVVKVLAAGFAPGEAAVGGLEPYRTRSGLRIELDRGRGVTGRVVDSSGGPLREAEVALTLHRPQAGRGMLRMTQPDSAPAEHRATTDGEGRFHVGGLRAGKYDLAVRRTGFAPHRLQALGVGIEGPEGAPTDLGEIRLDPGERLQGLVTDRGGLPLEGVEVFVAAGGPTMAMAMAGPHESGPEPDAVTGPDGWFSVEDLAAASGLTLRCQRSGFVPASVKGVALPRAEPLQVTLDAASDVSGVVVSEDGEPVAGARVLLRRTQTLEMAGNVMAFVMVVDEASDAEGRFRFVDQEPGTVALSAVASGYQEVELANVELPKGEDVADLTLRLPAGAIVHGRVLAPDGRPAIGAEVRPVTGESELVRFGGARTDGNGSYRVEGLRPGAVSIEATHGDHPRVVRDLELKPGLQQLDLQFEGGHEVSGTVSALDGTPVAGAIVGLAPVGRRWGGSETHSGADGTFVVPGLRNGSYELWAEAAGFAPAAGDRRVEIADEPVHGLDVRLDPGAAVYGRITGIEPERFGGVRVHAEGAERGGFDSQVVDSNGTYRIEHLAPGTYDVVAELADSGRSARTSVVLDPGANDVRADIRFEKGLVLSGRVVQADSAVAGALVIVEGLDVDRSGWDETGSEGGFRIEGLDAGRYRVSVRDFEVGLAHSQTIDLATGRELLLELPSGEVSGLVRDGSDRSPLAGAALTLQPVDEELQGRLPAHTAASDLAGRFRLRGIAAGEWTLSAVKDGYAAVSRPVTVRRSGATDPMEIALDPTEGMTLETSLPSGAAPDEIRVAVVDTIGSPLVWGVYATGERGRVRLGTVPAGTWGVVVSAAGSATAHLEASAPGAPVAVQLEPPTSLRVTVPELRASGLVATVRVHDAGGQRFRALEWSGRPVSEWRMAGGSVELASLPPRQWIVTVSLADGRSWEGRSATSVAAPSELVLD